MRLFYVNRLVDKIRRGGVSGFVIQYRILLSSSQIFSINNIPPLTLRSHKQFTSHHRTDLLPLQPHRPVQRSNYFKFLQLANSPPVQQQPAVRWHPVAQTSSENMAHDTRVLRGFHRNDGPTIVGRPRTLVFHIRCANCEVSEFGIEWVMMIFLEWFKLTLSLTDAFSAFCWRSSVARTLFERPPSRRWIVEMSGSHWPPMMMPMRVTRRASQMHSGPT